MKSLPQRSAGSLFCALALTLLAEGAARAQEEPVASRAWETQAPERRSGFTMGLMLGGGVAGMSGYPNDPKRIDRQAYYAETGARPSATVGFWLGGALTDWLTFGVGVSGARLFSTGDTLAQSGTLGFHIELFPLYGLGGKLRELGVIFNGGIGVASITPNKDPDRALADGGACSVLGLGVFYEGLRFWKISTGPFLLAESSWSLNLHHPALFIGLRTAFYRKP
jgi:hypothetical protein